MKLSSFSALMIFKTLFEPSKLMRNVQLAIWSYVLVEAGSGSLAGKTIPPQTILLRFFLSFLDQGRL